MNGMIPRTRDRMMSKTDGYWTTIKEKKEKRDKIINEEITRLIKVFGVDGTMFGFALAVWWESQRWEMKKWADEYDEWDEGQYEVEE
jgi:hypothetical protein